MQVVKCKDLGTSREGGSINNLIGGSDKQGEEEMAANQKLSEKVRGA